MEYFNTFAGNPAAGAAANAVMDVIERDGLQAHAATVGSALIAGFSALAERFPCFGSVRGVGLMVGIEIIKPPAPAAPGALQVREPDSALAVAIKYKMLARRILISTDGERGCGGAGWWESGDCVVSLACTELISTLPLQACTTTSSSSSRQWSFRLKTRTV